MCDCASCEATDRYAGLPDLLGKAPHSDKAPHTGFKYWPRGKPAGPSSARDYRLHASHCGSDGLPRPWRYVSRPPQFSTAGLTMPIPQAPKYVLDFIASGYKKARPSRPERARPETPAKAPQHLPEPDRGREPAKIYDMAKEKAVRSVGRPAMPGRPVLAKLEDRHVAAAKKLGDGNIARGIRLALEKATANSRG